MKTLTEKFIKKAIIEWLYHNGWGRNLRVGELRDHGVDIKVRHNNYPRYFLIETKGESSTKSAKSQREVNFIYSLGQIITRMNIGNTRYYYGLGLPESITKIAMRRIPWQVAKKLLIYIFSVNHQGKVFQYRWQDLKRYKF